MDSARAQGGVVALNTERASGPTRPKPRDAARFPAAGGVHRGHASNALGGVGGGGRVTDTTPPQAKGRADGGGGGVWPCVTVGTENRGQTWQ